MGGGPHKLPTAPSVVSPKKSTQNSNATITGCAPLVQSDAVPLDPPRFVDYPAKAVFAGKPAAVDSRQTPRVRLFRTVLREGAREGPNFANHPALARVKIQAAAVEINRSRKVRGIPEATGFALDTHDLAVEALGDTVHDRIFHESEHAAEMTFERGGDLLHGVEPRVYRPAIPVGEKALHGGRLAPISQRKCVTLQISALKWTPGQRLARLPRLIKSSPQFSARGGDRLRE